MSLNLKKKLKIDTNPKEIGPVEFHKRTEHILPLEGNTMQKELNELRNYAVQKKMKVNQEKSNIMLFNSRNNIDFMPEVTLGADILKVVEVTKLLGIQLRSDLKWSSNTDFICQKGFKRLWMLRRLKTLGAEKEELMDIFSQQ